MSLPLLLPLLLPLPPVLPLSLTNPPIKMEFMQVYLSDMYVRLEGGIFFFCPLCGINCVVSKTPGVSARITLRVLRHLAMDAMIGSIERLKLATSEATKAASLAYTLHLGSGDPTDAKDMEVDNFELSATETNYYYGKTGSTLLALVGSTCGALVLYDTQFGMTVVQGRNSDDPLRFDPKRSNHELLSVLEGAGVVRASRGPPTSAACWSLG